VHIKLSCAPIHNGCCVQAITRELPSQHKYTRTAALKWISVLLEKRPDDMLGFIHEILDALLNTVSDEADEVVKMNVRHPHLLCSVCCCD